MPREARGYEDDYRRGGVPSNRRQLVEEPISRDDRHRADRGEARERNRPLDDPPRGERPIRAERERNRPEREDQMDYAVDPRIGAGRGDPRANQAVRREERERETITAYRDPRTGQLRDARTHELLDTSGRPAARPREDYDDQMMMDRDEPPAPRRREREREREVYDSRGAPRDTYDDFGRGAARPGYGMNEYFVDGTGIEREVIQHDICRYLGNDATVRKYTNPKDVGLNHGLRNHSR